MSFRRVLPAGVALALLLGACSAESAPEPSETAGAEPEASEEPAPEPDPEPEPSALAPLTGLPSETDLVDRPALVVKIENSPAARPQSGLDAADLVYEELVEGGVTRFITVFHSAIPDTAGPVRSARPIDIQVASGLADRAGFAYSGARKQVQALLAGSPLVSVTEGEGGFYRETSRQAPHNLYVRTPETLDTVAARGATPPAEAAAFAFDDRPPACPDATPDCLAAGADIEVAMSNSYRTGFTYDADAGVYRRSQNGEPFTVTGDGRIGAANVVVIGARHYQDGCCDSAGSPYDETDVVGEGRAIVLRDGAWYEATWAKADATGPLRLLDGAGEPLALKPGPTWLLLPDASRLPAFPAPAAN